ncbi:regulatory protein, luxR family [Sinosporangium album]|uniref:Regulatory protein, luxR family n=1 Tax=Sinosporangium album TaxID=504805 RepID=A0A1G7WPC0_9ACTN|nr:regulatory protein, luxR family [Sinosporangium album]
MGGHIGAPREEELTLSVGADEVESLAVPPDRLLVSLSTVKTHLGSIFAKLGVKNRVGIAAWAWESGVMS